MLLQSLALATLALAEGGRSKASKRAVASERQRDFSLVCASARTSALAYPFPQSKTLRIKADNV